MAKVFLGMLLLCGGAFAAFIQSPIPPSTQQNFVRDTDGDGRMDSVSVGFKNPEIRDFYLNMIDHMSTFLP